MTRLDRDALACGGALANASVAHVRTEDPDEATIALASFCPGAVARPASGRSFAYSSRLSVFGATSAIKTSLPHGGNLAAPTVGDRYLIALCAAGGVEMSIAHRRFEVPPGTRAALCSPGHPISIENLPGVQGTGLSIERHVVEEHLATLTGRPARGPIVFEPELEQGADAGVLGIANLLLAELEKQGSPLLLTALCDALLTTLLAGTKHTATHLLATAPPSIAPRHVRRAEEYIAAHAGEAILLADIAAAAGVPARSLQRAFRSARGMTPMEFLKRQRLENAKRMLLEAGPTTNVREVALSVGYASAGRFSVEYRKCFGESPSTTLTRARIAAGTQ